jgi:hypothetical protein
MAIRDVEFRSRKPPHSVIDRSGAGQWKDVLSRSRPRHLRDVRPEQREGEASDTPTREASPTVSADGGEANNTRRRRLCPDGSSPRRRTRPERQIRR